MSIKEIFQKPKIKEINENTSIFDDAMKMASNIKFDDETSHESSIKKETKKKEKIDKNDDVLKKDIISHNAGHRSRLKEKFLKNGSESFQNYELIELLLTYAIPRADVKPLAKDLLNHFKSIRSLFLAEPQSLKQIKGLGESTIILMRATYEICARISKETIANEVLLNTPEKVINYCKIRMSGLQYEQFRVIFLNRKSKLISDEVLQNGTIDKAVIFPRELVKRALEVGAGAMILIHNHPGGDPTPSKADIDSTINIQKAANLVDVFLYDHIIIGKNEHYSMRTNKII
jgi:DNA repair protein RadC